MAEFVGLDVSKKDTSICVVDENGTVLHQGKCPTDPSAISRHCGRHASVQSLLFLKPEHCRNGSDEAFARQAFRRR